MRLSFGLETRQVQVQKLAPRMIQSMEILQLPIMALQERIEQELEENPVLELREQGAVERTEDGEVAVAEAPAEAEFNPDGVLKHDETGDIEVARMDELNREWDDHFDPEHRPRRSMAEELSEKKLDAMQNIAAAPQSLQDHLTEQLAYLDLTDARKELAEFVISHLDENGYLLNHDPDRRTP